MQETGNNNKGIVEFEFLDETFDLNSTSNYHLSIQLGLDGFSFSILNPGSKKYIALKNYPNIATNSEIINPDWIKSILKEDEFLNRNYKSVAVLFVTCNSVMVPDPLFKKESLKDYFDFNLDLPESQSIQSTKIERADSWSLFPVQTDILNILKDQFQNLNIFHQSAPFINNILSNFKNTDESTQTYVHLYGKFFDLVVFDKQKLQLYNCFSYRHVNDLLYYILYVFDQLKLPAESTTLLLSGKVTRQSSFFENLRRYVKKVDFAKRDPFFKYSYTFSKVPEHTFLNLLNLYPCV